MANKKAHLAFYQAYYLRKESEDTPSAQRVNAYYNRVFPHLLAGKSSFSWNWSAAIFGVVWLAYRRMYGPALALLIFEGILESMPGLTLFLTLVNFIFLGGFANAFYVYWIERQLQRGSGPRSEAVDTSLIWFLFWLVLSGGAFEFFNPNYTVIYTACGMSLFLVFRFLQQKYYKNTVC